MTETRQVKALASYLALVQPMQGLGELLGLYVWEYKFHQQNGVDQLR